jgi:hypothetical protein
MAFGQTVVRERRKRIPDPYNPDRLVDGPWDDPDTLELPGSFVASSSSSATNTATRTQVITTKSLYCTDPTADVRVGDRIRDGERVYPVDAVPAADTNPFTGWQPVKEIPLKEVLG